MLLPAPPAQESQSGRPAQPSPTPRWRPIRCLISWKMMRLWGPEPKVNPGALAYGISSAPNKPAEPYRFTVPLLETMRKLTRNLFLPARWLFLVGALGCILPVSINLAAETVRKPARTVLKPYQDPTRIAVKFRDGLYIRLRNNALVSTNAGLFANSKPLFDGLSAGRWERAEAISEDALDAMRHRAEANLGRTL